ncbi:solute carrier organic anion transporter family member 1B3 [Aplysia californica]|uniref:Solute carrier organic anion transporter family member n=1 Tax=Aplysia californica TaxID=6500 RepID=A0ABM0ZW24_APLCA|nr:solute carrier organic anion transporter family member 1B3 [Aplysia californica]
MSGTMPDSTKDGHSNGPEKNLEPESFLKKMVRCVTGKKANEDEDEEEITDYDKGKFGIGPCKPKRLQFLSNLWAFVFLYGPFALWSVAVVPFVRSQVTNIERHFKISSSKMGVVFSVDEIGYCLLVVPGSHYGKLTHIPRLLSVSGLVIGIGILLIGFSQVYEPVHLPQTGSFANANDTSGNAQYLCGAVGNNLTNGSQEQPIASYTLPWAFYFFACLMFITGAMKSVRVALCMFYIERNVTKKSQAGSLIGTLFASFVFGWPIAMLLGSFASRTPVDLTSTDMSTSDPRFIGAWWLGCLIIGILCVFLAIPVMLMPKHVIKPRPKDMEVKVIQHSDESFAGEKEKEEELKKVTDFKQEEARRSSFVVKNRPQEPSKEFSFKGFLEMPKSMWRVVKNPIVLLLTMEVVIARFGGTGYSTFEQKYMEVQFNKTSADISFTLGICQLTTSFLGTFLGGFISSRFNLSRTGMAKLTAVLVFSTCGLDLLMFWLSCDDQVIYGLTDMNISNTTDSCSCTDQNNLPVCGSNGVTYLSPCLAGCMDLDGKKFANCTEINAGEGTATPGLCDNGCPYFIPFMAYYVISILISTMGITPRYLATMRSVKATDQTMVMAVYNGLGLLLAGIPAPMVFGRIVDSACILWDTAGGDCKLYSREDLKWKIVGSFNGLRWLSNILLVAVLILMVRDDRRKARQKKEKEDEGRLGGVDNEGAVLDDEDEKGLEAGYELKMRRMSAISVESNTLHTRL